MAGIESRVRTHRSCLPDLGGQNKVLHQRQEQSRVPINLRIAGGSITVADLEIHRVLDLEVEVLARVTREL